MKKAAIILLCTLWCIFSASDTTYTPAEPNPDDGFIVVKGTPEGEYYPFTEKNIPIQLSDFYISPTEVTFAQMALYCYDNGLDPKTFHYSGWGAMQADRAAVEVNWFDAIRYCNWLSEQAGYINLAYDIYGKEENLITAKNKDAYFVKDGSKTWSRIEYDSTSKAYRLPTEAEWEYAASSYAKLSKKQLYAGTDSRKDLKNYAWYNQNSSSRAQKVKTRQPNALGIYDMSGNVREWCFDAYSEDISQFKGSKNPIYRGDISSVRRLRGGSWDNHTFFCKVRSRFYSIPNYRNYSTGFRLTRTY